MRAKSRLRTAVWGGHLLGGWWHPGAQMAAAEGRGASSDFVADGHAVVLFHGGSDDGGVVVGAGLDVVEKVFHGAFGADDVVSDDDGADFELGLEDLEVLEVIAFDRVDEDEIDGAFDVGQRLEGVALDAGDRVL